MFESHFYGFVVSRWVTTTVLAWTGRRRVTASWWPRWSSSWPTSTAPPRPTTSTPPGPTASPRSSMNRYAHELGLTVTVTVDFLFTLSTLNGTFCLPFQNWVGLCGTFCSIFLTSQYNICYSFTSVHIVTLTSSDYRSMLTLNTKFCLNLNSVYFYLITD